MRILHTMLRVGDLEKSLAFYTQVLGMQLLRKKDYPDGKFTLAFVGFGPESEQAALELTYNWGTEKYELGRASGTSRSRCLTRTPRARRSRSGAAW